MPKFIRRFRKRSVSRKKRGGAIAKNTRKGRTVTRSSTSIRSKFTAPRALTVSHESLLKYQSPNSYAKSLLDPFTYHDIRIPDLSTHPTATFQATLDFTFVCGPTQNGIQIALGSRPWMRKYQYGRPVSQNIAVVDLMKNSYTRFVTSRIVSAGFIARYSGNDANCSGSCAGAFVSALDLFGTTGSQIDTTTTLSAISPILANTSPLFISTELLSPESLAQQRMSHFGPIIDGLRMTYRPSDSSDFEMKPVGTTYPFTPAAPSVGIQGLTSDVVDDGAGPYASRPYIASDFPVQNLFYFSVDSASTASFAISLVINYEGIPVDDTSGEALSGVYCNPSSQAHGLNVAANTKAVTSATGTSMAKIDRMLNFIDGLDTSSIEIFDDYHIKMRGRSMPGAQEDDPMGGDGNDPLPAPEDDPIDDPMGSDGAGPLPPPPPPRMPVPVEGEGEGVPSTGPGIGSVIDEGYGDGSPFEPVDVPIAEPPLGGDGSPFEPIDVPIAEPPTGGVEYQGDELDYRVDDIPSSGVYQVEDLASSDPTFMQRMFGLNWFGPGNAVDSTAEAVERYARVHKNDLSAQIDVAGYYHDKGVEEISDRVASGAMTRDEAVKALDENDRAFVSRVEKEYQSQPSQHHTVRSDLMRLIAPIVKTPFGRVYQQSYLPGGMLSKKRVADFDENPSGKKVQVQDASYRKDAEKRKRDGDVKEFFRNKKYKHTEL